MSHEAAHRRPRSPPHLQNPRINYHQDTNRRATHSHNGREQREKAPDGPPRKDHTGQDAHRGITVLPCLVTPLLPQYRSLERPPLSGSGREPIPLQRSGSWSPSSSRGPVAVRDQGRRASFPPADSFTSTQHQPHLLTLLNETSHTKDMHHKRRRDSSSDDDNTKKLCLRSTDPDQTLQSAAANVPSPHSSSQIQSCGLELSPKTSTNQSRTESAHLTVVTPSPELKPCLKRAAMGAKQACIQSMQDNVVFLLSPSRRSELPAKTDEECDKKCNPKPSPNPKNVSFSVPVASHGPKSPNSSHQAGDNKTVDSSVQKTAVKPSTNPSSCRKLHRNKKIVIADDIQDLFTPDPTTYIVNSRHKTLKVMPDDKTKGTADESSSSSSVSSHLQNLCAQLCQKEKTATTASQVSNVNAKVPDNVRISLPSVILTRIPLPTTNSRTKNVVKQIDVEKDVASPRRTSVSPSRTGEQSEESSQEDILDLDLDLDFDLDLDVVSIRSSDSEDEQLVSLQEIMTKKDKPEKDMTESRALSESSNPGRGQHNSQNQTVSFTKTGNYKNSLDQILKEFNTSRKAKETEIELLTACQEDLLKIAEYEEAESREESISAEQQQFLQRFSLSSSAIRDVPPGHEVFNLEKFGRVFNQDTLQLRQCSITPQNRAQKSLLWSSHAQLKLYINIGLFQEAYKCSPCPFQITRFLFKMLSVHSDRLLSDKILQILMDTAYTAAVQRVEGNEKFKVWVPSLADITLVLLNMGAPFVSLFPLESLQPPFTEGDLLKEVYIKSENSSKQEPQRFPEHNFTNIYKYLSCCLGLCPRFYTDSELLLLLTLLCTISLESRLLLHTSDTLYPVLYKLLQNIRHWDNMMPKMCQALADITDDHHNMCHLAKLLPHHSRGMKLRQHLSVCMISKLLDGSCLYSPKSKELQLCDLRPYLSRMKPSALLRTIMGSSHQTDTEGEEDCTPLDQQAYYICYSLLTLVNEATNFRFFPAHQKEQLLFLCFELERHVKCHIREGQKWLYRSKVKDLVARIYIKWQMMLQKTRPLNGQLYDYWQPLQGDVGSSQDIEEIESSQDVSDGDREEAGAKMEVEEEAAEMKVTQNEETVSTSEETSLLNAAEEVVDEEPKEGTSEEARRQQREMDFRDGAPN